MTVVVAARAIADVPEMTGWCATMAMARRAVIERATVGDGAALVQPRGFEPVTGCQNRAMPLEFAERIRRIPVYPVAGGYALPDDIALLASNESPDPPLPAVVEAITRTLTGLNRYPATRAILSMLRATRPWEQTVTEPAAASAP